MGEEIIKILDSLSEKFGIAIDWTNQNVMPYLQELMTRFIEMKNVQAIMWIIISFIVIIVCITIIVLLIKWKKKNKIDVYDDEYLLAILVYVLTGIAILSFAIVLFCNIAGLIQNIYIPELSVVQYINNYI